MVEGARHFSFDGKGKVSSFEASRLEGERNIALMDLLKTSRVGPYVSIESMWANFDTMTTSMKKNTAEDLRRDLKERERLIKDVGNDSVAHLAISRDTLNKILRINDIAEVKIDRIDPLKKVLRDGVFITPTELTGEVKMGPIAMADLNRGIVEFDALVAEQKTS